MWDMKIKKWQLFCKVERPLDLVPSPYKEFLVTNMDLVKVKVEEKEKSTPKMKGNSDKKPTIIANLFSEEEFEQKKIPQRREEGKKKKLS